MINRDEEIKVLVEALIYATKDPDISDLTVEFFATKLRKAVSEDPEWSDDQPNKNGDSPVPNTVEGCVIASISDGHHDISDILDYITSTLEKQTTEQSVRTSLYKLKSKGMITNSEVGWRLKV